MMDDGFGMEAIRLKVVNGKVKMGAWSGGGTASAGPPSNWGSLYSVCHVISYGAGSERLCDRIEGIAEEAYRRSLGGVTNRLRQALRNANRYLYLRNRARGDRQELLAAMSCIAIRGMDAYACGVGAHATFIVSGGRVYDFANPMQSNGCGVWEDEPNDGCVLGRRSVLPDPKFSYRQAGPGDLVLIVTADDVEVLRRVGDALPAIAGDKEIKGAAQHIARLGGKSTNLSALLVRVGSDTAGLRDVAVASGVGVARRLFPDRAYPPSHRAARGGEAGERQRRLRRKSPALSKEAATSQYETPVRPRSGSELSAGVSRRLTETPGSGEGRARLLLQQSVEMCRLAGALVLSLIYSLGRGSLAVVRSVGQSVRRIWSWTRQHHILERAGRGCELALLACWAGSKGLIIRILPERQGSATTYGASARPMAKTKVVGFHPSPRSRVVMGALVMLGVFLVVTASAVRIKSRLEQEDLQRLMTEAEETMLLAEGESDWEARIALLSQVRVVIDQATIVQADDNAELSELSERLESHWNAITGVVGIPFAVDHVVTVGEGAPRRILIHEDQLYALDTAGQRLYRYALDQEGKPVTDQEPRMWEFQAEAGTVSAGRIMDIEWVDAANGRLTPALLMLTMEGSLLELNSAGVVRDVSTSDVLRWESPQAIKTYYGSLYVLDPGRENIIKYVPTGDDYGDPPVSYFQESGDIQWASVVDMAIDDSVYVLLSNGSIMKFAGGEPETFAQEGLYPPLESPAAIFASTDSDSVFVAEPCQERIVEFSRAGQFIRQFRAVNGGENPIGDMEAFEVDLRHDRLFIGTAAALYSAPLPFSE
jgi:hypothetical protein